MGKYGELYSYGIEHTKVSVNVVNWQKSSIMILMIDWIIDIIIQY